jgi:hypothetical protein
MVTKTWRCLLYTFMRLALAADLFLLLLIITIIYWRASLSIDTLYLNGDDC